MTALAAARFATHVFGDVGRQPAVRTVHLTCGPYACQVWSAELMLGAGRTWEDAMRMALRYISSL